MPSGIDRFLCIEKKFFFCDIYYIIWSDFHAKSVIATKFDTLFNFLLDVKIILIVLQLAYWKSWIAFFFCASN